ncbi:SusD family protein [Hydrobacter penzbergensis]|uniref:SusD family protein n=1 Tax=Hydrobacter penzbergensis TaxID=1235997 RepID=A0A8X8IE88_9BACT|nr:RagB/SusD family nutrient uptake outer membrane protein [Hydrobacter penzbergensis]SDW74668.1 SusD family protein [Hydrobacter penzbergensis]
MTTIKRPIIYAIILWAIIGSTGWSCNKYLEAKPDKRLAVPNTLEELQALLNTYTQVNKRDITTAESCADNFYLTDAGWASFNEYKRRLYTWQKDYVIEPINEYSNSDWGNSYRLINIANTVLDNIHNISTSQNNLLQWSNIKGQALFWRAKCFQQVAFVWALAYDKSTATNDLGIPLRLDADFNKPSVRSTVKETYDQIIRDLMEAIPLLPEVPVHVVRPSRPAAYGLLARTYLSMRQYDSCAKYASLCLSIKNDLMDYNKDINAGAAAPIPQFNTEVVFENLASSFEMLGPKAIVDSMLYASYEPNDIRKAAFFRSNNDGTYGFKGHYSTGPFGGIATDEVYLMRAECNARAGKTIEAMNDLNYLLIKRWKKGTYVPLTATDATDAVSKILAERRKELLFRGLRWMDIKRLNKDGAGITLKRVINGETFLLPPNDPRYAVAIPEDVIATTGMQQNPR